MQLQRVAWAFRALAWLAQFDIGAAVSVRRLAEEIGASPRFLEAAFIRLKACGVVASRRGCVGGYLYIRPPQEITYLEALLAVGGPPALSPCAFSSDAPLCAGCQAAGGCPFRPGLIVGREAIEHYYMHRRFGEPPPH